MKDMIIACLADSLLFASFSSIGLSRRYVKDGSNFLNPVADNVYTTLFFHPWGGGRKGPAVVSPFMKVSF